jgi:hypothetical protein
MQFFPTGKKKVELIKAVEKSELETTMVLNGSFSDYWVVPKVLSFSPPLAFAIYVAHNFAAIAGSRVKKIVFNHSWDVAKYVAKLVVSENKWQKKTSIIGDKVTWKEFLAFAEEAQGVKFDTRFDDLEMLKRGKMTELPSIRRFMGFADGGVAGVFGDV